MDFFVFVLFNLFCLYGNRYHQSLHQLDLRWSSAHGFLAAAMSDFNVFYSIWTYSPNQKLNKLAKESRVWSTFKYSTVGG